MVFCLTNRSPLPPFWAARFLAPDCHLRKMRLQRAAVLLKTTDKNVSEIAYEVGFSDPNYFSRAFHEEFGEAPSAMRN